MAKSYYLANVGHVIFMDCSNSTIIGMADTLTATTFDLSVSAEELRGGPGNPLLATTFHDQTLSLSYTDALLSTNMLAAMMGDTSAYSSTTAVKMYNESVTASSTTSVTLTNDVVPFQDGTTYIAWYKKDTDTEWKVGAVTGTGGSHKTLAVQGIASGDTVCCKYLMAATATGSQTINLNADYVPSVLHAIQYID